MKKQEKVFFGYVDFIKKNIKNPSENVLHLARSIEMCRIGLFNTLDQIDETQNRLKELLFSEKEEYTSIPLVKQLSELCFILNSQRQQLGIFKDQLRRNIPETIYYGLLRVTS